MVRKKPFPKIIIKLDEDKSENEEEEVLIWSRRDVKAIIEAPLNEEDKLILAVGYDSSRRKHEV